MQVRAFRMEVRAFVSRGLCLTAIAGRTSPASAMRAASCAITVCRSALSIRCQRAISGNVRPQPKQRLVPGSIIQTAMHGVSLLIEG